ncbi:MAG: hypothetical protein RRB22_04990 [Gammaproteobacteria bacterium]|nr:hypothetical protein [Gammaproteobacteria bacterium]
METVLNQEGGIDPLAVDLAGQCRAKPAPMLATTSATVTGCSNLHSEPSGKRTTGIVRTKKYQHPTGC